MSDATPNLDTATLGGGCFWCLEAVFVELRGVTGVTSGYAGGAGPNPTYEAVCGGRTGHAEVVQVSFDPQQITFDDLLEVFFSIHDPTTLNRQGADVGTQYRSVVFWNSDDQRAALERVVARIVASGVFDDPIVTQSERLQAFYPAEAEHRDYFERNPNQPYCAAVIAPKVAKFRKHHLDRLRA
ncbi:MAG: peptide-methionine (S)-S-oxide reductase MsrA [Candidatus Eisenbacteria bacterium]|uniref:Peptide methionine sulfoxide reductase MsrA n=1 Tax=Eiseniibacteriota bacterium TaxID=2212470 RepID=A0A849SSS5_UNCEI|nr:peptide-methionine (S)-S-oxide reductase MsrA [Candidatus Eisenbacteria bacterium]